MARRTAFPAPRTSIGQLIGRLISALLIMGFVAVGVAGGILYWELSSNLPPTDGIIAYRPPVVTQVFADDGTVIAEFFSEKRYLVPLDRIPRVVREAFIAAEDEDFYRHKGVDVVSIGRAVINNLRAGGRIQGGSTITQQVVKSILLSPRKSYERKMKEMLLSIRLEQQLSKDQILELYLNHIYLGSSAYGVAAAAREYFGKDVQDITLPEAALLAGLPQAPSRYSPFLNWPEAKARQRYVLHRMYEAGFITRDQRDHALFQPIALATRKGNFLHAPYFVEHVRRMLEERYGQAVYELGLRVHTSLNLPMQKAAETALRNGLDQLAARRNGYRNLFRELKPEEQERFLRKRAAAWKGQTPEVARHYEALVSAVTNGTVRVRIGPHEGELVREQDEDIQWPEFRVNDLIRVKVIDAGGGVFRATYDPTPAVEGALVALDPHTGHVKALVGGYDFNRSQFNRATQAKRQPGSSFKPLIYAAALDRNFTPASVIVDAPISYWDNRRLWVPQNFEKRYFGPTTLRDALTFSRNVVTVKLTERIGVKYLVAYLERFGLSGPFAPNLSIALGSAEVTPLELAVAYAVFPAGGKRVTPVFVTEIVDAEGRSLERYEAQPVASIPPETAYQITSMLQDVIRRGTGKKADGLGQPAAGKTGTTNDFHDNWFVGYTPNLLAAVWIGFDNKQSLGSKETGGRNCAPIWKAFMEEAVKHIEPGDFPVPSGLRCTNIDPHTGEAAVPGGKSLLECFRVQPVVETQPETEAVPQLAQPVPPSSEPLSGAVSAPPPAAGAPDPEGNFLRDNL